MRIRDYFPLEVLRASSEEDLKDPTKKEFFEGTPDEKPLKHHQGAFHPKRFIPEHHNILEQHRYEYKEKKTVGEKTFFMYRREQHIPGAPKYKITVRHDGAWLAEAPGHSPQMGLSVEDMSKYAAARSAGLAKPDKELSKNKPKPGGAKGGTVGKVAAGGPGSGRHPEGGPKKDAQKPTKFKASYVQQFDGTKWKGLPKDIRDEMQSRNVVDPHEWNSASFDERADILHGLTKEHKGTRYPW